MNNESFFQSAQSLLNQMAEKKQQAIDRGEYYNVFDVLNLSRDEVRHSMFIANLLNPKGKHGLGIVPLKSFTQILGLDFDDVDLKKCIVKREYVIGSISQDKTSGGYIDRLLSINAYLIVIENKIDAGDQPKQLLRYHNFVESKPHTLLYLTRHGKDPTKNSSDGLECGNHYKCISYRNEIVRWIKDCLRMAIDKPRIREILQQYLNTIRTITDTEMEEDKTELYAIMDKYPQVTSAIMKEGWGYRKYLVKKYIINPFMEWCKQKQYECHIGFEFENQDSGVWFGISLRGWKKYIAVRFEKQDYNDARFGIAEKDENNPYTVIMTEMTKFEKYKSWTVDIAKELISYEVFKYVCEKMELLMEEIEDQPEKHRMN